MSKAGKDRPRLGRGLSSLISVNDTFLEPPSPPEAVAEPAVEPLGAASLAAVESPVMVAPPLPATPTPSAGPAELPIELIAPNPHQPRRHFDEAALKELAASLKTTGLVQPIVVRKAGDGYELIAGERRLRAAKLAGLITIPAILRDVDGFTQAQMALVENIHRQDLNPIDRAQAYRALIDQLGLTQAELAGRLGEDRSSIANFLRLLELAAPVRQAVAEGGLNLGHAKLLAGVQDLVEQQRLAQMVIAQGLSVRNLERVLAERAAPPTVKPTRAPSAHVQDLEKSLARQLGMRVQVRTGGKGRGKLVVHYASLDQFDELMRRLGVELPED